MGETMDNAWLTLKRWAGACASNAQLEDIKAALEKGEKAMSLAQMKGTFSSAEAGEKLGRAKEGLGKVKETLETVENICLDIQAIGRIHDAIIVLEDESVIWTDTDAAAKAFGDLFVGFGRLARHLPSPAKEWGQFLEEAGDFFVDMNRAFKPSTRPSYRRQWSQIAIKGL